MRRWNLSLTLLGALVLALLGGWILFSAAAGAQDAASTARPPASAKPPAGQRPATAFCNPGTIDVPAGQPGITTGPAGPYPSVITVTGVSTVVVSKIGRAS